MCSKFIVLLTLYYEIIGVNRRFSFLFFHLGGDIVVYFIQVAIGGPFVGFIFAKITLFCLSRIFNDALAEITITLASTYVTYYVGKFIIEPVSRKR